MKKELRKKPNKVELLIKTLKKEVSHLKTENEELRTLYLSNKKEKLNILSEEKQFQFGVTRMDCCQEHCTDEDELAKLTEWIRSKKKTSTSRKVKKLKAEDSPENEQNG